MHPFPYQKAGRYGDVLHHPTVCITLYIVGDFNGREQHSYPLMARLNGRINM